MSNRDFAAHYRSAVGPRLRQACRFRGLMVACGDSYADAIAVVTEEAWRLGGCRLPRALWIDLEDHLAAWLLEAVEAAIPAWDAATARAERVSVETARYFRAWVGTVH